MRPKPIRRQELKDAGAAVVLALAVHLGVIGLLLLGTLNWQPFQQSSPSFTLVDAGPIIEARREEARQEELEREQELERQREEELQRQREEELERQREEELEREREEELEREREQQRQREEAAERQRQEEAERQRQAELERQRREAEQARQRELEEIRRQREEAQRRREEEERRLAELADRRAQEEAERQAREEAERRRLLEEQAAADGRRAELVDEYVETIRNLVSQNWIRPPTANPGVRCAVRVVQIPGGEIIDAAIVNPCNADDATRRSIIAAVNRTAELPYRGYESVFSREIEFIFRYDG